MMTANNKFWGKRLVLPLLFLLLSQAGYSQKFFIGYGLGLYTDLAISKNVETNNTHVSYSALTLGLEMKYNLVEFSPESALSISTGPSFGAMNMGGADMSEFGNFKVPVYVQYDFGTLSTYGAVSKFGFGIGAGYEYNVLGVFTDTESVQMSTFSLRGGFRYYNNAYVAREIALKFGFPAKVESEFGDVEEPSTDEFNYTTVQLSFIFYWNY